MGFNVGAAGAFAGGVSRGIDNFQADQERAQIMGERKQLMDQRTRRLSLEDASLKRDEDDRLLAVEARTAALQPIDAERKAFEQAATKTGADPAAYQPSKRALLRSAQAQADFFHKRGRLDLGEKAWQQAEQMRMTMRAPAAKNLLAKIQGGGSIEKELGEFDEDLDDGLGLHKVEEFKTPEGERAFKVWQKRRFDGKGIGEPTVMTARALAERAILMLQDPKGAAELTRKSYLENLDAANKEREAAAKAKAARDEEDHKQANRVSLDNARTANDLKITGAQGAEARKTNEAKDGGGTTDNNIKTVKQADNAIETVRRRMKDIETSIKDIDLGGTDSIGMSGPQRRATVTNNQDWQNANKRLGELNTLRDSLMKGGGLANAPGSKPKPAAGARPPLDSFLR